MCSSQCPHAAQMLSSAPDRYPLEAKITPLVYELNALRLMQPYWSCEGHESPDGRLQKPPKISFYSDSIAYVDLLVAHLHALRFRRALSHEWRIICHGRVQGAHDCSTFSLEPDVLPLLEPAKYSAQTQLQSLQSDIRVMTACFKEHFYALARSDLHALGVRDEEIAALVNEARKNRY